MYYATHGLSGLRLLSSDPGVELSAADKSAFETFDNLLAGCCNEDGTSCGCPVGGAAFVRLVAAARAMSPAGRADARKQMHAATGSPAASALALRALDAAEAAPQQTMSVVSETPKWVMPVVAVLGGVAVLAVLAAAAKRK